MPTQKTVREEILELIDNNPGLHFREIQRRTGTAVGQVEYHLYQLEKMDKIVIKKDGKLRRYFSTAKGSPTERKIVYYLRNNISREIVMNLINKEYEYLDQVLKARKNKRERVQNQVGDLINDRIIIVEEMDGKKVVKLRDKDVIINTLRRFKDSFIGTMASNLMAMFEEEEE